MSEGIGAAISALAILGSVVVLILWFQGTMERWKQRDWRKRPKR